MGLSCFEQCHCDAAVGSDKSFTAIVTRDWRGELVFAHTKWVETNVPVQAEAEAINWASQQVISHNISHALIESDSKVCIEALQELDSHVPWRISTIISDKLRLKALSHNVKYSWVPRDLNRAAHVLAKWSLKNCLAGIFVLVSAPSIFPDVILLEQNLNIDM